MVFFDKGLALVHRGVITGEILVYFGLHGDEMGFHLVQQGVAFSCFYFARVGDDLMRTRGMQDS